MTSALARRLIDARRGMRSGKQGMDAVGLPSLALVDRAADSRSRSLPRVATKIAKATEFLREDPRVSLEATRAPNPGLIGGRGLPRAAAGKVRPTTFGATAPALGTRGRDQVLGISRYRSNRPRRAACVDHLGRGLYSLRPTGGFVASSRPLVLVTNDDGIRSPNILALATALEAIGDVTVVAPDREQSATSHAMTIRQPLRISPVGPRWFAVEGTPTDCVNLAFFHVLERAPDLVVSGINAGFNLGEDVTYSGTVAGALEGRILGARSMAVSVDAKAPRSAVECAATIAATLARFVLERSLPSDSFLNVNVPDQPRGFRLTKQGRRAYREGLVARRDPKGNEYYWIGLAPSEWEPDEGADHASIALGFVSITPLHSDMTCHRALPELSQWSLSDEHLP